MLLVDTNIWLAAADLSSRQHHDCAQLLASHSHELASTVPVIAETAWLLLDRNGPASQHRFLTTVAAGHVTAIDLTQADWQRIAELVSTYADLALDIIDASTIAEAERLNETQIATLDHRDFRIVRRTHTAAFELLPTSSCPAAGPLRQHRSAVQVRVLWLADVVRGSNTGGCGSPQRREEYGF